MSQSVIGALRVNLGLNSAQFSSGVQRLNSPMRRLKRQLRTVRAVATAVAAAITGVTYATARTAREIRRLSQVANAMPREFQRWAAGADTVGIQQEKLADILKDTTDRIGDFVATGAGPMADFFENVAPKIGITADAFRDLSGPEALQLYVTSLERAGLGQQEMTFYMEALASDATLLLPLLRNNGAEMGRLADNAESLSGVLSNEAISSLGRFSESLDQAKTGLVGVGYSIAEAVAPALTRLTDMFVASMREGGRLSAVFDGLAGLAGALVAGFEALVNALVAIAAPVLRVVDALFYYLDGSSSLERAIDNTTIAMGDQITQANALFALMGRGSTMTVAAAREKLAEAEAHLENARALREETDSLVSLRLAQLEVQKVGLQESLVATRQGTDAYEETEAVIVRIITAQQELRALQESTNTSYEDARARADEIRQAIIDAKDGMVIFEGEVITAAELTDRLSVSAGSVDFSGAISGAYALGNNLYRALAAARALAGQRVASDAARARIAQARLNTVGDPIARAGAVAVQEYREEFSDGGYGLISGGKAGQLAEAEREIRAAAEAAETLEQEVRAADAAFAALGATVDGGGVGGAGGSGGSGGGGAAGGLSRVADAAQSAAERMQEMWENSGFKSFVDDLSQGLSQVRSFSDAWDAVKKSAVDAIQKIAEQLINSGLTTMFQNILFGGVGGGFSKGGLFTRLLGGAFGGGVKSFSGGGFTGHGPRSGGVDGEGGFWGILHPNETVIDHTRGGAAGGGAIKLQVVTDGAALVSVIENTTGAMIQQNNQQMNDGFNQRATGFSNDRRRRGAQ